MQRRSPIEDPNRRILLHTSARLMMGIPLIFLDFRAAFAVGPDAEGALILQSAARAEMKAFNRYVTFARKAQTEGYKGVSYLFLALAASELIHAQNYNRVLTKMGADIIAPGNPSIEVSDTRNNLIAAAKAELNSIKNFYPEILDKISEKANSNALKFVRYAWASHKQHKEIIDKIMKYAPDFFETVARKIDENSDAFYVCEICGSTTNEIPSEECPICGYPVRHYEKLDPSAILG